MEVTTVVGVAIEMEMKTSTLAVSETCQSADCPSTTERDITLVRSTKTKVLDVKT